MAPGAGPPPGDAGEEHPGGRPGRVHRGAGEERPLSGQEKVLEDRSLHRLPIRRPPHLEQLLGQESEETRWRSHERLLVRPPKRGTPASPSPEIDPPGSRQPRPGDRRQHGRLQPGGHHPPQAAPLPRVGGVGGGVPNRRAGHGARSLHLPGLRPVGRSLRGPHGLAGNEPGLRRRRRVCRNPCDPPGPGRPCQPSGRPLHLRGVLRPGGSANAGTDLPSGGRRGGRLAGGSPEPRALGDSFRGGSGDPRATAGDGR